MCNNLASVFYFLGYMPYWVFMAKYIETQYRQSASTSSLITGKQSKSSTARFNRVRKIAKSEYQLRHVRPYVRMEQLSSQWTDFDEI